MSFPKLIFILVFFYFYFFFGYVLYIIIIILLLLYERVGNKLSLRVRNGISRKDALSSIKTSLGSPHYWSCPCQGCHHRIHALHCGGHQWMYVWAQVNQGPARSCVTRAGYVQNPHGTQNLHTTPCHACFFAEDNREERLCWALLFSSEHSLHFCSCMTHHWFSLSVELYEIVGIPSYFTMTLILACGPLTTTKSKWVGIKSEMWLCFIILCCVAPMAKAESMVSFEVFNLFLLLFHFILSFLLLWQSRHKFYFIF